MIVVLSPTAIVMFTVAMLQQATVMPPNIIAHEKGFEFHAQPLTGAYSCLDLDFGRRRQGSELKFFCRKI